MMKKLFVLLLLAAAVTGVANAQTMVHVDLADGSTSEFAVEASGGMYLDSAMVHIRESRIAPETTLMVEEIVRITFTELSPVAIEEAEGEHFGLYPNPAGELVRVRMDEGESQMVEIYSMEGRLMVRERCVDGQTMDVSALPRGLYVVKCNEHRTKLIKK